MHTDIANNELTIDNARLTWHLGIWCWKQKGTQVFPTFLPNHQQPQEDSTEKFPKLSKIAQTVRRKTCHWNSHLKQIEKTNMI